MMRCWLYQSRQDNQAKQFIRKKLLTGAEDLYLLAKNKKKQIVQTLKVLVNVIDIFL